MELLSEPSKKKLKVLEDTPSMDVSFCDDEELPPGIIFKDVLQKNWRIGKPIGKYLYIYLLIIILSIENNF